MIFKLKLKEFFLATCFVLCIIIFFACKQEKNKNENTSVERIDINVHEIKHEKKNVSQEEHKDENKSIDNTVLILPSKNDMIALQTEIKSLQQQINELDINRGQTFGKHLDSFIEQCDDGDFAMQEEDYQVAKTCYDRAKLESDWIKINIPLRKKAATKLFTVEKVKVWADEQEAMQRAPIFYKNANNSLTEGKRQFENGQFAEAIAIFDLAMNSFNKALEEAIKIHLEELSNAAQKTSNVDNIKIWEDVLKLSEKLKLFDVNLANEWSEKANQKMNPQVTIRAMVNGNEVRARIFDVKIITPNIIANRSSGDYKKQLAKDEESFPIRFTKLKNGDKIIGTLAYNDDNDSYIGNFNIIIDWKANKDIIVELNKTFFSETVELSENVTLDLIKVKAGNFIMGSPIGEKYRENEEIPHTVILTKDFWLGKYEITQVQWKAVMGTTLWEQAAKKRREKADKMVGNQKEDYPIYWVNWYEAMDFCHKLTERERMMGRLPHGYEYTLPTEAEWEYACRAGSKTSLYNGDIEILGNYNAPTLDHIAWYGGNSSDRYVGKGWNTSNLQEKQYKNTKFAGPRKVGEKMPNAWGFYDMIGNVSEWCSDWVGKYTSDDVTDPIGSINGLYRVVRGGNWFSAPIRCRSAYSSGRVPFYKNNEIGFRVALAPIRESPSDLLKKLSEQEKVKFLQMNDSIQITLPKGISLELIKVQAGDFIMGGKEGEESKQSLKLFDAKPHKVSLKHDYWLGKFEVTHAQYEAVLGLKPPKSKKGDDYPVEDMSWEWAMYFCQKLTELVYAEGKLPIGYEFTLPTEAQWEYAACGGHMSEKYNKYSGGDIIDSVAWYADNAKKTTHPVGKKKANELGFYDMSGNVYEWCRDWFEEEYAKDAEFLHGNDNKQMDLRVAKGGGYTTKNPDNCRPSSRGIAPENGNHDVGFRIALAPIQ